MIVCSTSNIDLIYGVVGYGNINDGTTDWRITNTKTAIVGQTGIFSILNSTYMTPYFFIIENGNHNTYNRYKYFTSSRQHLCFRINNTKLRYNSSFRTNINKWWSFNSKYYNCVRQYRDRHRKSRC